MKGLRISWGVLQGHNCRKINQRRGDKAFWAGGGGTPNIIRAMSRSPTEKVTIERREEGLVLHGEDGAQRPW